MSISKKIQWYIRRIQVMDRYEILSRFKDVLLTSWLYIGYKLRRQPNQAALNAAIFSFCDSLHPTVFAHTLSDYVDEKKICGDLSMLMPANFPLPFDDKFNWHRAFNTGNEWPTQFFAHIDFRQDNPYGDVRTTWEPARLQMLVTLALRYKAAHQDAEKKSLAVEIVKIFSHWHQANPYLCGIHYISAMECGLRIVALSISFDLIRHDVPKTTWDEFAFVISQHATYIYHHLSQFSSAGNHTVAEAAGLIFAALTLKEHKYAKKWYWRGRRSLEAELLRQIHPDGGSLEQASGYLKLVAELGLIVNLLLKNNNTPLTPEVTERLEAAMKFLRALYYSNNEFFVFGDADGSFAASPALNFIKKEALTTPPPWTINSFADSGITSVRWQLANVPHRQALLLFHHHNLGMPPLFGHGHANALALDLAIDGHEVLIDCGTFAYNAGGEWRTYLRGTRAHNTIAIAERDQSTQISNFQWSRDISVNVTEYGREVAPDVFCLAANHDGYLDLGIVHSRTLLIHKAGELIVYDHLDGEGTANAEINWHVAGGCLPEDGSLWIGGADCHVKLSFPGNKNTTKIYYQNESPRAGWRSRHYSELEGSHTISINLHKPPLTFVSRFQLAENVKLPESWWHPIMDKLFKPS